jgi:hypothetical protein
MQAKSDFSRIWSANEISVLHYPGQVRDVARWGRSFRTDI